MIKFNIFIGNYFKINYSTFLNGAINKNSKTIIKGKEKISTLMKTVDELKLKFNDGGGEKGRNRQSQLKKLVVNERVNILFGKEKYLEIGYLAGYGQNYGNIPKSGCFGAIGYINERLCMVIASDATVKGGAIFPIQIKKNLRLQEIAINLSLPFIYIIDSGGAFLPLQADIFPDKEHGGRLFFNKALLQSKGIPIIAIVSGNCTAGGAYVPTMSTENGIVLDLGQFFLGGPALVKAATGEIMSAEELGGAVVHNKLSGASDYIYQSEIEGLQNARDFVSGLPNHFIQCKNLENSMDPLFPSDELNYLLLNFENENGESADILKQILARILDGSCLNEFKCEYGSSLITGMARICGYAVGIVACHGKLTEKDCVKGSHFIQICGHRNTPIISFVHSEEESVLSNMGDARNILIGQLNNIFSDPILKAKSSMMRSLATRNCKLITVVIGDAVGMDYICLGGRSMDADFVFAWPNARFGWYANDLEDVTMSTSIKAAGDLIVDDVIEASQTRMILKFCLDALHTKTNLLPMKENHPVYRF